MDKVRITRAGDSNFKVGQIVELSTFLNMTEDVLKNGGEMPIANLAIVVKWHER